MVCWLGGWFDVAWLAGNLMKWLVERTGKPVGLSSSRIIMKIIVFLKLAKSHCLPPTDPVSNGTAMTSVRSQPSPERGTRWKRGPGSGANGAKGCWDQVDKVHTSEIFKHVKD